MKHFKKVIITIVSIILLLVLAAFIYRNYFYDKNNLNIKEQEWILNNKTTLININVPNKLNVFGYDGNGVFFNFIESLEGKHEITFNKVATDEYSPKNELGFYVSKEINEEDMPIYKDYYVVISKTEDVISSFSDLSGQSIGTTPEALARLTNAYSVDMVYNTLESSESLLNAFETDSVKYLVVPKTEYLDVILANNYKIVYHLSDLSINYYLRVGSEKILNSIIEKYYNDWINNEYEKIYYENTKNLFVSRLNLTQLDVDTLTNKNYKYGYLNKAPYYVQAGAKNGGIAASYLEDFSKLSNVEFTYVKFNTNERLVRNFNNKDVDIIFDDLNIKTNHHNVYTNLNNKFYIITPLENDLYLSNIRELNNDNLTVMQNSKLYGYLSKIPEVNLKTVANEKELIKASKNNEIIAIDANAYEFYNNQQIIDYTIKYTGVLDENFAFKYTSNNDAFYKLFRSYINTLDNNKKINEGLITYKDVSASGNIISYIAKYTLIIVTIALIIAVILYFSKNKLKLNTKIKKDEKLKFIDILTSLKNRNYLNEKKDVWNLNSIYPQAVIILDLNNIKYLNDTFNHDEGDKQIKAAANILIKTQLDNTEIIRTDGNEFMVYLVGYSEKQVLNYMKKLVKEFKKLPYEYGAAFGFSIIEDDLKLIDDAINEATIQMRENKNNLEDRNEELD